jgi:hydroxymethylglutaryl-CoA reductase (NADPH)
MSVPSFLLKKLYVKGSLKNTESGFELALRNNLAPGTLIGMGPLTIDDVTYQPDAITITTPQAELHGGEISSKNPVTFAMNVEVKIAVQGPPLAPGEHHVVFSVMTREIGRVEFDVTDSL